MNRIAVLILSLCICHAASAQSNAGYYRYPAIFEDTLIFAAEGDLWTVPVAGGAARRLTTHPGEETHPAISPDGSLLAFTATYEGPSELYAMPLAGGVPERLTYDGDTSVSLGFTPDGQILFTTSRFSTLPDLQLATLDPSTRELERIPLSQGSEASFSGNGERLFFVRPRFHNNVTKRYRGGTARQIWRYDGGRAEARRLTVGFDGESHTPMWWDGRVYFISDRDGTMNVWSMDENGGDLRQHTEHSGWDVRDAYLDAGRIAYQVGADLWIYDIASDASRMVPITLVSDFDQLREKWITNPFENLTSLDLNPEGTRIAITTRGRVFVAPVGDGRLVNAAVADGVRFRDAVFMPDGESLLALSDVTGEVEFVRLPANGVGTAESVTSDGAILRFRGLPSPDGNLIAYTDNNLDLWLLELASGQQTLVSTNREGIEDFSWSGDSRFLSYSQYAPNLFAQLFVYDVAEDERIEVTSDRTNSWRSTFSRDGKFLYFISDRDLRSIVGSPWGPRQPEPYFDAPNKIYEIALTADARSPFKVADELFADEDQDDDGDEGEGDSEAEEGDDEAETVSVEIDVQGLNARIREVPAGSGEIQALSTNDEALFWLVREPGRDGDWNLNALAFGNEDPEIVTLVADVTSYDLSDDGKKIMIRKNDGLYVFDAAAREISDWADHQVDLGSFGFALDVREDWRQIFVDAWRLERDYFYDPGMHGVDWEAVREKYLPLVDRVTTRDELSELIGRVVGELSALHTSVRGGDLREGPDDIDVASLGARLTRVEEGFRIDYVYQADPDYPDERSPLADHDLGIEAGEVIVAINGVTTSTVADIGELLRNQASRQVLLELEADDDERRQVVVTPIADEFGLRYSDWEVTRRQYVDEEADGRIGYVHLRAMGANDITAWYRQFYPVFNRAGLIIDVRHNNGGNIDSLILEKLLREPWFYWKSRASQPTWNMQYAPRGHMVVLVDELTASDGEAFAEGFRRLGLGPVIGVRTWGGEIWLNSSNTLSDGGLARAPMLGVYGPEREWLIEGRGVEPDIVVDNLPVATFNGDDAQLDTAIEYLLDEIARDPREIPAPPPYPDLSFEYPE